MNLLKKAILFFKDFIFHAVILYIFLLSPLGSYDPYLERFLPSHFQQLIEQNDALGFILQFCVEMIFISCMTLPIISLNFYLMRMNTFRREKEDYIATKMVLTLLGSTILSFPFRNILGAFNFVLPMFLTTLSYVLLGYFRWRKSNAAD
jgi:hypothetical protein